MEFDTEKCAKCPDYEVCAIYTGHGCLQEMKQSLKQNKHLNKNELL